jgi:ABC-type sugar transport system ATPase subunit
VQPLFSLRGICKSYGGVEALRSVAFDIHAGEVLALCGGNGAGKSSLVKILSGAQLPSAGAVLKKGQELRFHSPRDALRCGIATIYQDLALVPRLSIAENIFLGHELSFGLFGLPYPRLLDKGAMKRAAAGFLSRLNQHVPDMSAPVAQLSGGQRQAVAIARALRWQAELVLLDEPTAALGVAETAVVLTLIKTLRAEGRAVLLISHNMADICAVATRVVIMKSGCKALECSTNGLTPDRLAELVMRPGTLADE